MGLPRELALKLAAQSVAGSSEYLQVTGKHPGELKDKACEDNPRNIHSIDKLEECKFRGAVMNAVESATGRSKELGNL